MCIIIGRFGGRWSLALLMVVSIVPMVTTDVSRKTVYDDPFAVYEYRLYATSPFGRIPDTALPGSEVPVDTRQPHWADVEGAGGRFLRLTLEPNDAGDDKHQHNDNKTTTAAPDRLGTTEAWSLPPGLMVDVSGEEGNIAHVNERLAFAVDDFLHIVVDDPQRFQEVDEIEFWVVAIRRNKSKRDVIVSNPLAFVVKIDHPEVALTAREGAALYVGIVVLVVCLFALLIPLTVRTKRRLREGKPVCACGSSASSTGKGSSTDGAVSDPELAVVGVGGGEKPGAKGQEASAMPAASTSQNLEAIFEGRTRAGSVAPAHETFQSKNMRSVSDHHFQPRWLDPHYRDTYQHPVYSTHRAPAPARATPVTFDIGTSDGEASSSTSSVSHPPLTGKGGGVSSSEKGVKL